MSRPCCCLLRSAAARRWFCCRFLLLTQTRLCCCLQPGRYKPPGNYVNQMGANVMPLITSTPTPTPPPTPPPTTPPSTPPPTPPPTPAPSTAATVVAANTVIAQSGSTSTDLASGPNCRFSPNRAWSICVRHTTGRWVSCTFLAIIGALKLRAGQLSWTSRAAPVECNRRQHALTNLQHASKHGL